MGVCWARRNRSEVRGKRARSTRFRRAFCAAALAIAALVPLESSVASETITYTYDARGRLVAVSHGSTGPNAGISASYSYDKGDNRTNVTVATPATACSGVSFSVNDASATEGNSVGFNISKVGSTTSSCTVSYSTTDGTAVAGTNYVSTAGSLTFSASEAVLAVSVATIDDHVSDFDKTFSLNLTVPTAGAALADGAGVGTVHDSGASLVLYGGQTLSSSDGRFLLAMQTDGNLVLYGPDGPMWWTSTTGGSDRRMVMQADGNLVVYNGLNQPLWGSNTAGNPGSRLVLQNDGNLVIYTPSDVGIWSSNTVYHPCTGVSFNVAGTAANEGSPLVFTVGKTGSTSSSCSVNYATSDDTAVAGTDYIAKSGTLTFSSTQTSQTVSVSTIDNDRLVDRYMYLNLTSPTSGATLSNSQASGTILHSGGTGGCTLRCQTPLQSPEAIDSTVTTQPAPDPTVPPQPPGDR